MLNTVKNKLLCVRGNCDTEVDQMVLDFPVLADYAVIPFEDKLIYATHGHIYNENNLPPICDGDILLNGHTHVPKCTEHDNYIYMNPGSVSIPKENSKHSYMIFENGEFLWKDIETGQQYKNKCWGVIVRNKVTKQSVILQQRIATGVYTPSQ